MVDAGFLVQELDTRVGGGILAGTVVKVTDQSTWTPVTLILGAVVTMFITAGSLHPRRSRTRPRSPGDG